MSGSGRGTDILDIAMSQQNVELVRRLYARFAGSFPVEEVDSRLSDAALAEFFDPEVEWLPVPQSLLAIDSFQGYDGVRRFWREFRSMWDEYEVAPQELLDAGDQVVVVMRMQCRTGDLAVDETWSSLQTVRDGRVVRVQGFSTIDGAARAAGLGNATSGG
jgi:ketosteroid isomerase-like protein